MKLCADKFCTRRGMALNESEFPRNKKYATQGACDGRHIYCRQCAARRVAEYRDRLAEIPLRAKVKIPATQFVPRGPRS